MHITTGLDGFAVNDRTSCSWSLGFLSEDPLPGFVYLKFAFSFCRQKQPQPWLEEGKDTCFCFSNRYSGCPSSYSLMNKSSCLRSGRLQRRCENAPGQRGKASKVIINILRWCSELWVIQTRLVDNNFIVIFFFYFSKATEKIFSLCQSCSVKRYVCLLFHNIPFIVSTQADVCQWNHVNSEISRA